LAKAETRHPSNKILLEKIGSKIRKIRKEKGLTIEELATIAEVHPKYLQKCETAKYNLTVSVLFSVLSSMDISLNKFFKDI
jgi:transcriptional regulator with XRE-family HTH domain